MADFSICTLTGKTIAIVTLNRAGFQHFES